MRKTVSETEMLSYKILSVAELGVFGLTKNSDLRPKNKLDRKAIDKIIERFKRIPIVQFKQYLTTSIHRDKLIRNEMNGPKSNPVLLCIRSPKGSHIGWWNNVRTYLGKSNSEPQLLLERKSTLKITSMKMSKILIKYGRTKEFLLINAELH